MEEKFPIKPEPDDEKKTARASKDKAYRTMSLAILLQVSWPTPLTREAIRKHLPLLYGDNPWKAINRDIETLTGCVVEELPEPSDEGLAAWCTEQQRRNKLALIYDRPTKSFILAQSVLSIDINDDEARAFVALQEGFTPGTPYGESVQNLLKRWQWLFSEQSRQLVQQKRKRRARPVSLPLSPVVDYSRYSAMLLQLDEALEIGAYISFKYTPLGRGWDDEPEFHEHVEPYELEYREGHWYFTAHVFDRNTFLDYRIDRIHPETLKRDGDHFTPGLRERRGVKIRYWVAPQMARHKNLSARLREQHVTILDDDQGAIVEGYAKSLWWAARLLLGYGEQVRALEPAELVEAMRKRVQAMWRLYEEEK